MVKCRLADLNIEFTSVHTALEHYLFAYRADFDKADVVLETTQADIEFERQIDEEAKKTTRENKVELTAGLRKIGEILPNFDGAVLHSCSFKVGEKGIALGAYSGTGKSTHMLLWQELLKDKFEIINGDKPLVRFVDGKLYVYGCPWAGKENLKANVSAPLTDICEIVRSKDNHTEKMSREEGRNLLYRQIYMPFDPMARIKTIQLIEKIADAVTFWRISCNMELDAAETAYKAIFDIK